MMRYFGCPISQSSTPAFDTRKHWGPLIFVLDCKILQLQAFSITAMQVLSTRKRKDVEVADITVQVCLFAFDCLYLDGEMLLQRPLTERRAALLKAVHEKPGELQYALYKVRLQSAIYRGR